MTAPCQQQIVFLVHFVPRYQTAPPGETTHGPQKGWSFVAGTTVLAIAALVLHGTFFNTCDLIHWHHQLISAFKVEKGQNLAKCKYALSPYYFHRVGGVLQDFDPYLVPMSISLNSLLFLQ